ncbi:unnamed protein product [Clavelina lepadiformis]|uniref:Uncharacterized protein n=1 Tax=Clavelina lepadiformis TaxID=159417 RepID=A0ABP0F7G5_CLALP
MDEFLKLFVRTALTNYHCLMQLVIKVQHCKKLTTNSEKLIPLLLTDFACRINRPHLRDTVLLSIEHTMRAGGQQSLRRQASTHNEATYNSFEDVARQAILNLT